MAYFGCHDWQSWCAAAQLGIPEPGHVLFAKIDTGESLHFSGAWRDSEGYVTCSRNLDRAGEDPDGDPQAGVERRSDEDMLSILLGWCEDDMLRELGADWTLYGTDLPWQIIADEAFALAAQLGVTVAWAVREASVVLVATMW